MDTDRLLFLIPYLMSAFLSLGILLYTWRKRYIRSARELSFFLLGQTFWLFGNILEMIATDVPIKIFWDKFQWIGGVISLVSLPYFAAQFANDSLRYKLRLSAMLAIIPVLFTLLLFTDQLHHLLYPDPVILTRPFFPELNYTFTWLVYTFSAYSYIVTFGSVFYMMIKTTKEKTIQRMQIAVISIGLLIPIFGTILSLAGIHFLPQRDSTPLFTAIGNVILAWGLFRFRVFEFLPIARETIVENMDDVVVVLDAQDRIVDINKQGLKKLELKPNTAIGMPASSVITDRHEIIEILAKPGNYNKEMYFVEDGEYTHYDIRSSMLNSPNGEYLGRIFVARDVSSYAHLQWELKTLNENLEARVSEQTREIAESYETTLEGWARALELRDKETEGHSRRVVEETVQLALALGVSDQDIEHIRRGAILHDIGKMGIPDEILLKPGKLTVVQREIIKQHPGIAYSLLKTIPYLSKAIDIPYCHHERWDGNGYPRGLKGEEIPLAARIFSVVDVWDALCSDRGYSKAWPPKKALQYIAENSGVMFDPLVVKTFLARFNEVT